MYICKIPIKIPLPSQIFRGFSPGLYTVFGCYYYCTTMLWKKLLFSACLILLGLYILMLQENIKLLAQFSYETSASPVLYSKELSRNVKPQKSYRTNLCRIMLFCMFKQSDFNNAKINLLRIFCQ